MTSRGTCRCGSVAIVGRPNVGKSTLLNRFLGQKIAIVSPKPETTRDRLLGILTLEGAQILFLDTPGIYRGAKTLLARHQIDEARGALAEADVILMMTEAQAGVLDEDRQIVRLLPKTVPGTKMHGYQVLDLAPKGEVPGTAVFLAINKVDRVEKKLILPQIETWSRLYSFKEIFPISATKGDNVGPLLNALREALPEGPALYPADQVTDRPVRELARELTREKVLLFTHEEIPHAVAVTIEEWRPGKTVPGAETGKVPGTYIRATIYVERNSQKGILIGKEGSLLKRIGQAARKEIEDLVEGPVYLDLWVKVAENWRKNPRALKELGYG